MDILTVLSTMVGITAFIVLLINVGKVAGLVKDGQAPIYNKWLRLVVYAVLIVLHGFFPDLDLAYIDQVAAQIASAGALLLGLVPAFAGYVAPVINNGVRGL